MVTTQPLLKSRGFLVACFIQTEKPEQKTLTEIPKPEQLPTEVKEEVFEVAQLPENIMIRDLGEKLNCSPNDIIKELMDLGVMTNINQSLSFEVASKVFERRKLDFDENEQNILSEVYDMTKRYRNE